MADHDADKSAKGGSAEAIAQEVKNATTGMLKRLFKIDWDTIAQLGAAKIRKKAEELAEKAKQDFPVDAWARSDAAEVFYNIVLKQLKNALEILKDGALKTSLKELAEFLEVFVIEFCNEENGGHKKASKTIDPETAKVIADYKKAVMTSIQARLDAASDADYDNASKNADKRMRDAAKMVGYMTEGVPEEKKDKPKGPTLGERLEDFAAEARPAIAKLDAETARINADTAAKKRKQELDRDSQPERLGSRFLRTFLRIKN